VWDAGGFKIWHAADGFLKIDDLLGKLNKRLNANGANGANNAKELFLKYTDLTDLTEKKHGFYKHTNPVQDQLTDFIK
jgi:hypothetical protein